MNLLNQLVKRGLINDLVSRDILAKLESKDILYPDDDLVKIGISEEDIKKIRSEISGISTYDKNISISIANLSYVDESFSREYRVLPIDFLENKLIIGIVDFEKNNVLAAIEKNCFEKNVNYELRVISNSEYEKNSTIYYDYEELRKDTNFVLNDVKSGANAAAVKEVPDISNAELLSELDIATDSIDKIVDSILKGAINSKASDIHIEHVGENVRVRCRIDGVLEQKLLLPANMHASLTARIKILCDMKIDEKRKPQDGRFSIKLDRHKIDFRVSSMPSYYGEKIVMRILDSFRGIKKLEDIGFNSTHLEQIRKALERPFGMILISGPTGSGKTTTLYSMVNQIDREKRNVVSLEDPVEYNVPNMNQSQIFPEIGYTFASGLRSILRQDPDVIMVGEIRDSETAQLAIQAALTGHLVFSTIHTNNSIGVVSRLTDMGVDPYLIAPTLILSIAQRLVPKIYPKCVSEIKDSEMMQLFKDKQFKDLDDMYKDKLNIGRNFSEAIPAEECPTGTKGRVPVLEVFEIDNDVQNAIVKKMTDDDLYKIARKKGMISMREDAMFKSMEGLIPFVEIAGL
jgi:type IV pilus assembly protein PilB